MTKIINEVRYEYDFHRFFFEGPYSNVPVPSSNTTVPHIFRWFEVGDKLHACKNCRHKLHYILDILGISHDFVCTEYSDDNEWGGNSDK